MKKDNFLKGNDARDRLFAGIKKTAEVVGNTMGSGGSNALIECIERPGTFNTNDGITIARAMILQDPVEDMGRKILLEAIERANKSSGDGSSTTCVLTAAIIEEGLKRITEVSPLEIKKSLEECLPSIEASIEANKRDMMFYSVKQVATVSAEDEKIGDMLQEIFDKIGKDGIVQWDISKTFEDSYTIGNGITIEGAKMVSPYMADLDEVSGNFLPQAKWHDVNILITRQKIMSANDFNTLFEALDKQNIKQVAVFCDEYEPNVVSDLIRTRAVRGFKTLLIKMPTLFKDWWYADLAIATGAVVIDPIAGVSFKTMNQGHLGFVEHLTVDQTDTYLDGIKDVSVHVQMLKERGTDDDALRASRLNTKTARYYVGAQSDSALSYRRLKVEDAIAASWQALQNGVVAGGGKALYNVREHLPQGIGAEILNGALLAPFRQIIKNAGASDEVFKKIYPGDSVGYNAATGEVVDMFKAGIIDPTNVVLNSVRNAISVAASILTCSVIIELPRQDIANELIESILTKKQ